MIHQKRGFTLLELIIVIAILAILSVAVVLVINPAETLRRARDSQRFSDLSSIKSAIGLYMSDVSTVDLDTGAAGNQFCLGADNVAAKISYSFPNASDPTCTKATPGISEGADVDTGSRFEEGVATDDCRMVTAANVGAVSGAGWIPVNLNAISSGAPIGNFPVDPTNTVATVTAPINTDLVYRYACQQGAVDSPKPTPSFEVASTLEATLYLTTQDKDGTDGGDDANAYETGTSLRLIGDGDNY